MAEGTNGAAGQKLSLADAVKLSLGHLGEGASLKEVVADVKQRSGVDVRPKYAGRIRAEALGAAPAASGRKQGRPAKRPTAARAEAARVTPQAAAAVAPAARAAKAGGEGLSVRLIDLAALRDLMRRVGADETRRLIDFLEG